MLKRLRSKRFRRWPVTIAWLAALSASAWVAADLVLHFAAPSPVAASYRTESDPAAAARAIVGAAPMALETVTAAAPARSVYTLVGAATGFGRDRGFALVKGEDGRVIALAEGDELAPGVRLARIHADRVELDRGGVTDTLTLEAPQDSRRPPAASTAPSRSDH